MQNEYRWRHRKVSNEPYNKKSSSGGTYRTRCVKQVRGGLTPDVRETGVEFDVEALT